jgi:hypothetical protein
MFTLLQSGFGIVMIVLVAIVHIGFSIAIKRDADVMLMRRDGLFLVSPGLWAFGTLLGGVTVVAAYWAIHYSTLRPPAEGMKKDVQQDQP